MRKMPLRLSLVIAALGLLGALSGRTEPADAAVSLTPGFVDTFVATAADPTSIAFTPDGRLLIAGQGGQIRVYKNGMLLAAPALNLGNKVCRNIERGLVGLAVDPGFASNHFIYAYYTFNKFNNPDPSNCPTGSDPAAPVNRLSRFTLGDNDSINPASELVLVDNIASRGYHNSGDLHFGADGYLYVSVGDASRASNARVTTNLNGKILRLAPTSADLIPPSNPLVGQPDARRCGDPAGSAGSGPCLEIFNYGLRNPFRFAFRPGTNEFYINDVGQDTWEDINLGQGGGHYGWPCREGAHPVDPLPGTCNPLPPVMVDPVFEYQHGTQIPGTTSPANCNAITGGAFVPAGLWPGFDDVYLFGDYVCGVIIRLTPDGQGGFTAADFAAGVDGPTQLLFGPHLNTQALYYTARNSGQVRRITYSQAPSAQISANPNYGALTLTFSAAGSFDPDNPNETLTYDWTFGDGATLNNATGLTATHAYASAGIFTATLIARDSLGLPSEPAALVVYPGYQPPVPAILAPAPGQTLAVGQTLTLTASVTDSVYAPADLALHWEVLLHHVDELVPSGNHTHPWYASAPVHSPTGQITNTTTYPAPEGLRATRYSYVEVRLTASNPLGLTVVVTRAVQPRLVDVTLTSDPAGLPLRLNDAAVTTPHPLVSWEGYALSLAAPAYQLGVPGAPLVFTHWLDGGNVDRTVITPDGDTAYTAVYAPGLLFWLPVGRR